MQGTIREDKRLTTKWSLFQFIGRGETSVFRGGHSSLKNERPIPNMKKKKNI